MIYKKYNKKETFTNVYNITNKNILTAITTISKHLSTLKCNKELECTDGVKVDAIRKAIKEAISKGIDIEDNNKFYKFKILKKGKNYLRLELLSSCNEISIKITKYERYEKIPTQRSGFNQSISRDKLKSYWFHEINSGVTSGRGIKLYYYILKDEYKEHFESMMYRIKNPLLYSIISEFSHNLFDNTISKYDNCNLSSDFLNENGVRKSKLELYDLFIEKTNILEVLNEETIIQITNNENGTPLTLSDCSFINIPVDFYENLKTKPRELSNIKRFIKRRNLNISDFMLTRTSIKVGRKYLYTAKLKEGVEIK